MTETNISYFRDLWLKNTSDLEHCCKEWEQICNDYPIPDDVHGEIRTVIGLARLLLNQKLKQFKGLIDDSEFNTGEKEITCLDLEGFWDMVYYEVEKIQKSFKRLSDCRNNDWKFVEEIPEKLLKKVPVKQNISAINKKKELSKAHALAARQRIAELKKKMAAQSREDQTKSHVDILISNKKEFVNNHNEDNANIVLLNDKPKTKESTEKRKSNNKISSKQNVPADKSDLNEELSKLNSSFEQKSAQKKKYKATNKENVLSNDSSDSKLTPSKQAKFKVPAVQETKKIKNKKNFGKLQCVTRSAAKKALFQQNSLQK